MAGSRGIRACVAAVVAAAGVSLSVVVPTSASAAATPSRELFAGLVVAREHGPVSAVPTPRWADLDGDGCLTPNDVLVRDAVTPPRQRAGCRLTGGVWRDSLRGGRAGDQVVATLVPVTEAWRSGAWSWPAKKLRVFANDLGYQAALVVSSQATLQDRADEDPATWLPAKPGLSCRYLSRWVAVKQRWGLTVDPAERRAIRTGLAACGWPRVARPPVPPVPSARTLGALVVSAASLVVPCAVTAGEPADVVVRFRRTSGPAWRRSSTVAAAAGRSAVRVTLRGLLPATSYLYRCTVTTESAGRWPAPGTSAATTLARAVPATSAVPAVDPSPASPVGPPPTTSPPVTSPPVTSPPVISPPVTSPPVTSPPETSPPVTSPPVTSPPVTSPPATSPPATSPPPTSPPPSGGTHLVAVGDMCEPNPASCTATGNVAAWLDAPMYALIGDEQYENGTAGEYAAGYARSSWDALKQRSLPAIGNHEIQQDPTAAGYCGYFFGSAACPRWYAYDIDSSWRAIVLDSNQPSNGTQLAWLDAELAQDSQRNLLVYWHHPRWRNSGSGHNESSVGVLMERLYKAHADIVLWGHDHMYTRWAKVGPTGPASDGFRAFTVGTGGAAKVGSFISKPGTEKNLLVSGVLELSLRATDYTWRLVDTSRTVRDQGSDSVTP
jgi:hypothetical protein